MIRLVLTTTAAVCAAALTAHGARPTVTLGGHERAATAALLRDARAADARAFHDLDEVLRRWLRLTDRRNEAVLSRWLRALGKREPAVLIDSLAGAGLRVSVPDDLRVVVDTALVDALGRLDDERALPVLRAAFVSNQAESVQAAAARGLAASCRGAEAKLLLGRAVAADPLFPAAVEGLGRCLRPEAAERLAALLSAAPDAASARPIAAALGRLASQRVWSAPTRRDDPAGVRIRVAAARALAGAIARLDEPELPRALAVVHHADTSAFLAGARAGADAAGLARLDHAASRLRSPALTLPGSDPK